MKKPIFIYTILLVSKVGIHCMSIEDLEARQLKVWREWFLAIQGFFYFAQGVAFAALLLLPVIMKDYLLNPVTPDEALTYQSIIMIPWYIKLLYGLLSDNISIGKFGRRKPYIVIAGALGIVGWFVLPAFKSFNPGFVVIGILLSLSIALSDAVIDSLAVDITPEKRRGWMQGVGWGGRGAGTALAGIVFYKILGIVPWTVAFYIAGGLIIIACIVALFYKEPDILNTEEKNRINWKEYKIEFKKKEMWLVTLFMLISGAGIALISTFTTFLSETTTINLDDIGLGITFFALGQFVGAAFIGILGNIIPLLPVMIVNTVLYIGGIVGLIFIPLHNLTIVYLMVAILGGINGGYEATQMRIGMEYSQGPIGGSLYNWYMSFTNIGQITLGAIIIGQMSKFLLTIYPAETAYPYAMQVSTVFLALAIIPAIFLILWLRKRKTAVEPEIKISEKQEEITV